ncbi:MAG: hypothetical protein LBM78_01545 [Clostridiales bacterium]|jgi:hypothetical protein|nr:hypothetical protein [Clostridiales bacterium]
MFCKECGSALDADAATCPNCGWSVTAKEGETAGQPAASEPAAASTGESAAPKKRKLPISDTVTAVLFSIVAIVLLRHSGFLSIGYSYQWAAWLQKTLIVINWLGQLVVIAGAAVLAVFGFLAGLRSLKAKAPYGLVLFTLGSVALVLAAITAVSVLFGSPGVFGNM